MAQNISLAIQADPQDNVNRCVGDLAILSHLDMNGVCRIFHPLAGIPDNFTGMPAEGERDQD